MDNDQVELLLEQVEQALEEGEVDRALKLCDKALKLDPSNIDVRLLMADVALEEGEADEVLRLGQEIVALDANNSEGHLLIAEAYLAMDKPEEAAKECDLLLRADPGNLDARFYMAEALLELGGAMEAAELYEGIVEERPDHAPSVLGLGVALYECCEFDDAVETLKGALELEEDMADAWFFLGLIAERRNNDAEAKRCFKRAQEIDPEAYPTPISLSIKEFEKIVQDVQKELPKKLLVELGDVPISIEEFPSEDDLTSGETPLSPNIWGIFRGPDRTERQVSGSGQLPSEIILFRRNLQRGVRTKDELREEIRTTLLHEIGHYLGWDEEEVARRGLA
jgi:predicted Zn-dependent protease with MMP-like domain/predicted Zn-dependent protease